MTTKTLLLAVAGVFLVMGGLYLGVAPIAERVLNGDDELPVATTTDDVASSTTTQEPTTTPEVVVEEPTPAPVVEPEPAPAPAPTPEPEPTPGMYTMADVSVHNSRESCWSVVNGLVYDLTAYVPKHPGGASKVLKICGRDGTSAFEGEHGGESKPERILESYKIGELI